MILLVILTKQPRAGDVHSQKGCNNDSVAQLVEQLTLNQWVESSSLSGVTTSNDGEIAQLVRASDS